MGGTHEPKSTRGALDSLRLIRPRYLARTWLHEPNKTLIEGRHSVSREFSNQNAAKTQKLRSSLLARSTLIRLSQDLELLKKMQRTKKESPYLDEVFLKS